MRAFAAVLMLLAVWPAQPAVLTNGDQVLLQRALDLGGQVVFSNFSGTITLTNTLTISTNVTLDGGGWRVQLSGGGATTAATNSAGLTNASGATISVPSASGRRIFDVSTRGELALMNIVLANGRGDSGGAILNYGTLVLNNCALVGNGAVGASGTNGNTGSQGGAGSGQPGSPGADALGGAICNYGFCTAVRSLFLNNAAVGGGGGAGGNGVTGGAGGDGGPGGRGGSALGGAIYSARSLNLMDCIFSQNLSLAGNGGRGGNYGGGYSGPLAGGQGGSGGVASGGALHNTSLLTVSGCTFIYNSGLGGDSRSSGSSSGFMRGPDGPAGGDSRGAGICNEGTLSMWNSTFFHNRISGGLGGAGATNVSTGLGGDGGRGGHAWAGAVFTTNFVWCYLTNCTLVENSALGGRFGQGGRGPLGNGDSGPAGSGYGGNAANGNGIFVLRDSLLANAPHGTNVSTNITFTVSTNTPGATNRLVIVTNLVVLTNSSSGANAYGTFTSANYNFSNDGTPLLSGNNLTNGAPRLGPLLFNGGPTPTLALLPGSPAIDSGDPASALSTDQRGRLRPEGGRADIGAYEADGVNLGGRVTQVAPGLPPLSGVAITASAPEGEIQVTTGTDGRYGFTNLPPGTYIVEPAQPGYDFRPPALTVTIGGTNVGLADFAAAGACKIIGHVWDSAAQAGLPGATALSGTNSSLTDPQGHYVLTGLAPGLRTVMVTKPNYAFLPTTKHVTVDSNLISGVNFDGFPLLRVSGRITDGDDANTNAALRSVTVTLQSTMVTSDHLTNSRNFTMVCNTNGEYAFTGVPGGTLLITPARAGYAFRPPHRSLQPTSSADLGGNDFQGYRALTISGRVTYGGSGLPGVTVTAGVTGEDASPSDSSGAYTIAGLRPGTYPVQVSLPGYVFTPSSVSVVLNLTNVTGVNFAARGGRAIQGRIARHNSAGMSNVTVTIGSHVTTTSATGQYAMSNLPPARYTVLPRLTRCLFVPASNQVDVTSADGDADFLAIPLLNISGRVTNSLGGFLASVTVAAGSQTAITSSNGYYALVNVPETNLVVPTRGGFWFAPPFRGLEQETILSNISFSASATFSIQGRLTEGTNGLPQFTLNAAGTNVASLSGTVALAATTTADGRYSFPNLAPGTYTISPAPVGVGFSPPNVLLPALHGGVSNLDFVANPPRLAIAWDELASPDLTLLGLPSRPYAIHSSASLVPSSAWLVPIIRITDTNASFTWTDTNAPSAPVRFYRPALP